jgi:hypothetical protein
MEFEKHALRKNKAKLFNISEHQAHQSLRKKLPVDHYILNASRRSEIQCVTVGGSELGNQTVSIVYTTWEELFFEIPGNGWP